MGVKGRIINFISPKKKSSLPSAPRDLNELFWFCVSEYSPENFIAWVLITNYKNSPTKRKSIFIYDNFIQFSDEKADKYGGLINELNVKKKELGSIEDNWKIASGLPQTFGEKVERLGVAGAIWYNLAQGGMNPPKDVFDPIYQTVIQNLSDTMGRFTPGVSQPQRDPGKSAALMVLNKDLTMAGWSPHSLGLY